VQRWWRAMENKDKNLRHREDERVEKSKAPLGRGSGLCLFPRTPPTHPQGCERVGRSAPLRRRGAQLWGRRAAHPYLTRRGCLSAVNGVNVTSSAARPQSEHRSAVGGTPPTAEVKRSGLPARSLAASTTTGGTHFLQSATQRQKADIQTAATGRKPPYADRHFIRRARRSKCGGAAARVCVVRPVAQGPR
jgi:hypothetical protein